MSNIFFFIFKKSDLVVVNNRSIDNGPENRHHLDFRPEKLAGFLAGFCKIGLPFYPSPKKYTIMSLIEKIGHFFEYLIIKKSNQV